MNSAPVLECISLCQSYTQGGLDVNVLKGIDIQLFPGECLAITGASGSGKSTLLHLLGGLDSPVSGEVYVDGKCLSSLSAKERGILRNNSLGFVYQFHHLLPEFTALENVAIPLLIRKTAVDEAEQRSRDILQKVGLGERILHKPGEMSGGERQRAAIARAIVTAPQCILADEPTGNLDEKTAEKVFDVMMELNSDLGISLVMVTHNHGLAQRFEKVKSLHEGILSAA